MSQDASLSTFVRSDDGFEWHRVDPVQGVRDCLGTFPGNVEAARVSWSESLGLALVWTADDGQAWLIDLEHRKQTQLNPPTTWGERRSFFFSNDGRVVMDASALTASGEVTTSHVVWVDGIWTWVDEEVFGAPAGADVIVHISMAHQAPGPRPAHVRLPSPIRHEDVSAPDLLARLDQLLPSERRKSGIWTAIEGVDGPVFIRMAGTANPDTYDILAEDDVVAYDTWPLVFCDGEALSIAPGRGFDDNEQVFVYHRAGFLLCTNGWNRAQFYDVAAKRLIQEWVQPPTPKFWPTR